MKKRLTLLFAAVLLALPLGASAAMADGGGNSNDVPGDTGNACPEASPQGADEDRSCGNEGNQGNQGKADEAKGDKGDKGQGDEGDEGDEAPADACTAAAGDPGILTDDTLGQTLVDGGLDAASPLFEDPDADGAISGEVHGAGNGTDAEPLTDEIACAVDAAIDPSSGLPDL